jgi:hydroxymethylbilane synthase
MRIGTRGSLLALTQARLLARLLATQESGFGEPEIVVVRTSGDAQSQGARTHAGNGGRPAKPLGGDKSRWVAELEHALLAGKIDLAVHSAKDVPSEPVAGLELLGAPARAAAQDALIGARSLAELPEGAHVGTSSVRRAAQLRAARADLDIVSLRGNVDTRLRKLADQGATNAAARASADGSTDVEQIGESEPPLHAIVLASAGLRRLGRESDIGCELDVARFVPAPGQGLLALQARSGDERVTASVEAVLDQDASACLKAERAVARALGASCNTPLGAHATAPGCGCLHLRAWVGLPDGSQWLLDELLGGFYDPEELGQRVAARLQTAGGRALLERAEEMAVEHG